MNREEFLTAIREKISILPQGDVEKSLEYYEEMIEDYIEDGMTEEEAIKAIGSADDIASQILNETPLPKLVKAKIKPKRAFRVWEIVLLAVGSVVWFPLLLAAIAVFFAVYIVIWSFIVVLYSLDFSFAALGIAGTVGSVFIMISGNYCQSLLYLGVGLFSAGVAILLFFCFNKVTSGVIKLSKIIIRWVKFLFIGKGETK